MKLQRLFFAGALVLASGVAQADVKLASVFSDDMVLPRDREVPIWGTADAGEAVSIESRGATAKAVAGADGRWMTKLPSRAASATPFEVSVRGKNTIVLKNVLQGDVWLSSGQSNMEWRVNAAKNAKEEIAAANYPNIRLFYVGHNIARTPQREVKSRWQVCTPETAAGFSAVAYYFGREVHQKSGVPIGLITASWGGTMAEPWTSAGVFENDADFKKITDGWAKNDETYATNKAAYDTALATWQAAADTAKAAGTAEPEGKPTPPRAPSDVQRPTVLFNGMIAPLTPFAIRGVIWYQGESNAWSGTHYGRLFPALITDWRTHFEQPNLPFYWVQLAGFQAPTDDPNNTGQWPALREAQDATLSLPNTGQALAIDIGEADIHPRNKQDVGRRLALVALRDVYKQDIVASGPRLEKVTPEGNTIRVSFTHSAGLKTRDGAAPTGFAISADGKKWVWAEAKIDGTSVVLSSPTVEKPIAARYAWQMMPVTNLINAADLPAAPFQAMK